jgi:hypothetical protein
MFRGVQILRNKNSCTRIWPLFQCNHGAERVGQVEYFGFDLLCLGYN